MILTRHVRSVQNIHRHHDQDIIEANVTVTVVHHHRVHIRDLADAAQAAAVMIVVVPIHGIQIDRVNIQDVSVHRAVQAMAVTNVINIHMNEAIREVIAINTVVIEFFIVHLYLVHAKQ